MAPPRLVAMCQRACVRNIAGLQDVGEISYDLLRPILRKIENTEQLRALEIRSPHIADHTAELWKAFIARDIMDWKDKIVQPKDPRSWWQVYRKLLKEDQRAKEAQEEQLRKSMKIQDKERKENSTNLVYKVVAEPKRPQAAFVDGQPNPNVRCWGERIIENKPALRCARTGTHTISAMRKQSAAAAKLKGLNQSQGHIIRPYVPSARSQIKTAPRSMVESQKVVRSQDSFDKATPSPPKVAVSRDKPIPGYLAIDNTRREEQEKKERRLKALTAGSSNTTAQSSPSKSSTQISPPIPNARNSLPKSDARSVPLKATTQSRSSTPVKPITGVGAPSRPKEPTSSTGVSTSAQLDIPRVALKATEATSRRPSPSPAPGLMRKRPATPVSVFMPSTKRRKV